MESLKSIYDIVKSDFCNLLDYKLHGNTIEILTGIPTINESMVSVFVSWDGKKYIASDGAWIDDNVYDSEEVLDGDLVNRVSQQYRDYYAIKTVVNGSGSLMYYKTCNDVRMVSAIVHEVGNFIAMYVNISNTKLVEPTDEIIKQKQFQTSINKTLRHTYGRKNVHTNYPIDLTNNKRVKLNAVVNTRTNQSDIINCLMYITGTRNDMFVKDLTKATVTFKVIAQNFLPELKYRRFAIINTSATGYKGDSTNVFLEELREFTDADLILAKNGNLLASLSGVIPYNT